MNPLFSPVLALQSDLAPPVERTLLAGLFISSSLDRNSPTLAVVEWPTRSFRSPATGLNQVASEVTLLGFPVVWSHGIDHAAIVAPHGAVYPALIKPGCDQ